MTDIHWSEVLEDEIEECAADEGRVRLAGWLIVLAAIVTLIFAWWLA